ncbi:unnamed protein product [Rhizophagus irregularis]|nr:unnamed protein product [Rhizophagus irregularis]
MIIFFLSSPYCTSLKIDVSVTQYSSFILNDYEEFNQISEVFENNTPRSIKILEEIGLDFVENESSPFIATILGLDLESLEPTKYSLLTQPVKLAIGLSFPSWTITSGNLFRRNLV